MSEVNLEAFLGLQLPLWAPVRLHLDRTEVGDVAAAVAAAFAAAPAGSIRPGQRVALTGGSRGIDRIDQVLAAAVAEVKKRGAVPFIVPAMGSHGGATAEGQVELLAGYGITPATMGCEIRSSMDTVQLGEVEDGVPVFFDRNAYEADVVIPINRVKPHTDFHGPVESGLVKMIAIGLGKQKGADNFHRRGFAQFHHLLPAVAQFTLSQVNIPFGLALVENGFSRLYQIEALPAAQIWEREQQLLNEARDRMARLPLERFDVLVLDYIGKDISGLGMDSNVVGRYYDGPTGVGPNIQRIVVRDLTPDTEGNGVGLGMADVALQRAVDKLDRHKTYMNCLTAKTPEGARIPMLVDSDREALAAALACCLDISGPDARIVRLRDTKHLERLYASEPLLAELEATGRVEILGRPEPIRFDKNGMFAVEGV